MLLSHDVACGISAVRVQSSFTCYSFLFFPGARRPAQMRSGKGRRKETEFQNEAGMLSVGYSRSCMAELIVALRGGTTLNFASGISVLMHPRAGRD